MKKISRPIALALLIAALIFSSRRTQQANTANVAPETKEDRIALYQALLDLQNPWTVMCIAAHPDDEDGTSLTVLRHKYGAHTVSLFTTFGEGGQNAIGPELYEELGVIRVRETMAAAEIQGSEAHFLGMKDFGFSKSPEEAFKFWGHDEALRRMVLQIRQLRPDVIITNHSVNNRDHGHHQATARLEVEAFDAAADPKRFPEQLKDGVEIWQVKRLFVRAGFGGGANAQQQDQTGLVTIDPNEQDPIRGTTYAEQALAALQKHATQGPWPKTVADMARFRNSPDGKLPLIRYRLTREIKDAQPLPGGAHTVLEGLRLPEAIEKSLTARAKDGRPLIELLNDRAKLFQELEAHAHGFVLEDLSRFLRWRESLDRSLALSGGIKLTVVPSEKVAVPGSAVHFSLSVSNGGSKPLLLSGCLPDIPSLRPPIDKSKLNYSANYAGAVKRDEIAVGSTLSRTNMIRIPKGAAVNLPLPAHLYEASISGLEVRTLCTINDVNVSFNIESTTHIDVGPAVEIASISPSPLVIRPPTVGVSSAGADIFPPPPPKFSVQLISHLNQPFKGEIVFGEENRKGENRQAVELPAQQSTTLSLTLPRPTEKTNAAHSRSAGPADSIWFSVRRAGSKESITDLKVPVVWANAHVARKLVVGYVRGFDFSLPDALTALGVESKELSVADIKSTDLQKYSTIIVDNRVYESEPELIAANQRLLDYAKDGGTLVVFYHKTNEWNPDQRRDRPQLAPYPLTLANERITDENAAVTFLEADHPLLNVPNKIGADDFEGWIQERGLYYPKEWDSHYHALVSANDPGEKPLTGGLLVADYGRGHYIYTSMVWYRQLRAGIPGGYRMFANMISYGHQ